MEKIFANGILYKKIPTKFGEMKKLSIKIDEFIEFLNENKGDKEWLNLNINKGKDSGKYYIELDTRVRENNNNSLIKSDEEFEQEVKNTSKKPKIEEEISIDDIPF